jgi:hypothetical protein
MEDHRRDSGVRFWAITVTAPKIQVFWDATLYRQFS